MNIPLDNYKAPPLISGSSYTWNDIEYTEIEMLGRGRERECWKVKTGNEFRAVLKAKFTNREVNDLVHFRKVVARLEGHPNIVKTYTTFWSFIKNDNVFFIIQECYTNCIVQLINEYYFSNNEVESHSVFLQLSEGLSFMHERGVTNNDISLDNILFKVENNRAIVAYGDLGGADLEGEEAPTSIINPYYSSPSRIKDQLRTKADDVCSLGICMAAIQWDYKKGGLELPFEEFEKMPQPKSLNICMMNFKAKLELNRFKDLFLEMMADFRNDRPSAQSLVARVKEIAP